MPIYEFTSSGINLVKETSFSEAGLHERRDLQRLLREHIEVVASETLIIAEEFGNWDDSRRRIDLLGIDKAANLVVIELKRTDDGGHMELQALRYAAMVSTMTFDQAADEYARHLEQSGENADDARARILEFLGWDAPDDDQFAQDVRIVLASAEFSKEITSSVLWLLDRGVDIRCVRMRPYNLDSRILVDVQQIVPLPEAAEFQIQVREKVRKERQARTTGADFTRYDVTIDGERYEAQWKRNAIHLVCRTLCLKHDVAPEALIHLFAWRPSYIWYWVEGHANEIEFERLASTKAANGGPTFSKRRWFCDDDDLFEVSGNTYAFSKQWGGDGWHRAMNLLKESYPRIGLEFTPTA